MSKASVVKCAILMMGLLILSAKTLTPSERTSLAASVQAVLSKNSLQRDSLIAEIRRIEQLRIALADPVSHLK